MTRLRWLNLTLCMAGFLLAAPLYYLVPRVLYDATVQVAAATHIRHGKGYAKYVGLDGKFQKPASSDLEQLVGWPPGYSLLLAAVSSIIGHPVYVRLGLLLLAALITTLCCFYLGEVLLAPYPWIATGIWLAWIIWSFPPFFSLDSDNFALTAFLLAVVGMFRAWRAPEKARWAVLTAVAIAASAWIRFAYWSILPAFALSYFFCAEKNRTTYRWMALHLSTLAVLILPLLVYQKLRIGHFSYLGAWTVSDTIFHWEYLQRASPFPLYVIVPEFHLPSIQLEFSWLNSVVLRLSECALLGVIAWSVWRFTRRDFDRSVRGTAWLAGLVFILTIGMLVYCTVTIKQYQLPWVYVAEPRYYAPAVLLFCFLIPKLLGEIHLRYIWFRGVIALGFLLLIFVLAPRHWNAFENYANVVSRGWKRQQQANEIAKHVEVKVRESSCVYFTDEDLARLSFGALTGAIPQTVGTLSEILDKSPERDCSVLAVLEKGESPKPSTQNILNRLKSVKRISMGSVDLAFGEF